MAASVYARSAAPNDSVFSTAVTADVDGAPPPYLSSVSVSTAGLQSGDSVKVVFYESNNTTIISEVSTTGGTVSAPSNAFFAYVKLITGSSTGVRYAWFTSATNTNGITANFDAPDTSDAGGGGGDPGGGTDPDPGGEEVVELLQTIIGNQEDMLSDFGTIKSRLGTIVGQLDTANSHLGVIKSDLGQLKNYIITPRNADPIEVQGLNSQNFDPTPPPLNDPPQQPYKYNRNEPTMPPFIDSPGPLPINPDPTIMPHDPVAVIEQPNQRDNPLNKDPVIKESPRQKDPVIMDDPLTRDPVVRENPLVIDTVIMDSPIQKDPVIKDDPISRDPVIRDNPISRESPLTMESPGSRENPISREQPITPDPPTTPTTPM